jgi:hypothetical protein
MLAASRRRGSRSPVNWSHLLVLLVLLACSSLPAAAQPTNSSSSDSDSDEDGSFTQEITQIAFLITRPSGRVCRPSDQEEIRGRLTSFGNEFRGVDAYSTFVQPTFSAQVSWDDRKTQGWWRQQQGVGSSRVLAAAGLRGDR